MDVPTSRVIPNDVDDASRRTPLRRAHGTPSRVLVVIDEQLLAELVSTTLRREGWVVATAATGARAVAMVMDSPPDAIVLDLKLPDMKNLDAVCAFREQNPRLPLLLLTAKHSIGTHVAGLTASGDDFVTKPFSLEELVLRLRALMRRNGVTADLAGKLVVGDLVLDEDSHEVSRGGDVIALSGTEYELLRFMMRNSGRVLNKLQILDRVWSYDFAGRPNVVELYVSYLRKKIEAGRTPMIHTLRGSGYVLRPGR